MLAAYGHANKTSGFTKSGEFLNYLLSASENGAIPWKHLFWKLPRFRFSALRLFHKHLHVPFHILAPILPFLYTLLYPLYIHFFLQYNVMVLQAEMPKDNSVTYETWNKVRSLHSRHKSCQRVSCNKLVLWDVKFTRLPQLFVSQ